MSSTWNNVLKTLQGRVPGLDLDINSGQITPSSGITLNIRGHRSLMGFDTPMVLVDGIPYGTTLDLNPSDIASIEVLKDASSTAIFGTRGSNGVILVTTKQNVGKKLSVSFNAYGGINKLTGHMNIMNGPEYAEYRRELDRRDFNASDDKIFNFQEFANLKAGKFTNWPDLLIANGSTQNYELSVGSGNSKYSTLFSLGLNDTKGLFRNENQRRYNLRFSGHYAPLPFVKLGGDILYTKKRNNMRRDRLYSAYQLNPLLPYYNKKGEIMIYPYVGNPQLTPLIDDLPNIYSNRIDRDRIFATAYVEFKFLKWITFNSTFGLDKEENQQSINDRQGLHRYDYPISITQTNRGYPNILNHTTDNTLSFDKTFGKHDFDLLAGFNFSRSSLKYSFLELTGRQEDPSEDNYSSKTWGSGNWKWKQNSYFGRLNYNFNQKYLFSASFRKDHLLKYSQDETTWGLSAGWRIGEEQFLRQAKWVDELKLRVGTGRAANNLVSNYQIPVQMYATTGDGIWDYPPYLDYNDLYGETNITSNIGIDFSLFKGRLSGSMDYYRSTVKNGFLQRRAPAIDSETGDIVNNMENRPSRIENKGVEVLLSSANLPLSSPFQWHTTLTLTHNKEKISDFYGNNNKWTEYIKSNSIGNDELVSFNNTATWMKGQPIHIWYDYKKVGIWQTNEKEQAAKNYQQPGEIKVYTSNADGRVTSDDKTVVGTLCPKFILGIDNTFSYKGVELSIFLYGKFGHTVATDAVGLYGSAYGINCYNADYWTPTNPTNAYPRPNNPNYITYASTLQYISGDFLKIKDITLAYSFPKTLLKKWGIGQIRVYATATNLHTFCNKAFGDFDPERAIYSKEVSFPMMKQIIFGLNFTY